MERYHEINAKIKEDKRKERQKRISKRDGHEAYIACVLR